MRKIGLTLITLTFALAACGEAPTAAIPADAGAAMNEVAGGSGSYEQEEGPGYPGSGHTEIPSEESSSISAAGNPGLLGSGH